MNEDLDLIPLGESPQEACPYLNDRNASLSYACGFSRRPESFDDILAHGYRRSGVVFYRPCCPDGCRECIPIRIPVERFRPSKSQRRLLKRYRDAIRVDVTRPRLDPEHVALFNRHARFVSDTATQLGERQYIEFLLESGVETMQFEYSVEDELLGVGFLDLGKRSASSIYFFWEPGLKRYSPGTYSCLTEIEWCREHGYEHYYLGYWIEDCPSMSYKDRFQPFELMDWSGRQWKAFE